MVQPAIPTGGHAGGFRLTTIDHPAAGASFAVNAAFLIDVAKLVFAHTGAFALGMQKGAKCRAIPPRKKAQEKKFHQSALGRVAALQ